MQGVSDLILKLLFQLAIVRMATRREYAETDDSGKLQDLEAGYPNADATGSLKGKAEISNL